MPNSKKAITQNILGNSIKLELSKIRDYITDYSG